MKNYNNQKSMKYRCVLLLNVNKKIKKQHWYSCIIFGNRDQNATHINQNWIRLSVFMLPLHCCHLFQLGLRFSKEGGHLFSRLYQIVQQYHSQFLDEWVMCVLLLETKQVAVSWRFFWSTCFWIPKVDGKMWIMILFISCYPVVFVLKIINS